MFNYWLKQEDKPIFPDILWSRPENKSFLPKVVIVGGSKQGFAKSAAVYQSAAESGCSSLRLFLPSVLKDALPPSSDFVFVDSNRTGSFDSSLYDNLLVAKPMTDVFVISEDSGKESETVQAIHKIIKDDDCDMLFAGKAILANDSYFDELIKRKSNTTLVLDTNSLQKVASRLPVQVFFKSDDGLVDVVKKTHSITKELKKIIIITKFEDTILIVEAGEVFSSKSILGLDRLVGRLASFHDGEISKSYISSLSSP